METDQQIYMHWEKISRKLYGWFNPSRGIYGHYYYYYIRKFVFRMKINYCLCKR